jgi:hypothetical protein
MVIRSAIENTAVIQGADIMNGHLFACCYGHRFFPFELGMSLSYLITVVSHKAPFLRVLVRATVELMLCKSSATL